VEAGESRPPPETVIDELLSWFCRAVGLMMYTN